VTCLFSSPCQDREPRRRKSRLGFSYSASTRCRAPRFRDKQSVDSAAHEVDTERCPGLGRRRRPHDGSSLNPDNRVARTHQQPLLQVAMTQLFRLLFPKGAGLRRKHGRFACFHDIEKEGKDLQSRPTSPASVGSETPISYSTTRYVHCRIHFFSQARSGIANPQNYARRGVLQAGKQARRTCS
jgi:hypothetical protein